LAGVALGGMTTFTVFCFALGLLRATKIVVAQAVGAGRLEGVRAQLGASLVVALGLGCVIALIGQGIAWFLPAFTASAESGEFAASYARVRMCGAPTLLVGVALRETRQALGDAQSPMRATLLANVLNLGLVAAAMLWLGAGVAGVAWATTLAQLVEALLLARMQRAHGFGLRDWTSRELRTLLRVGVPLGIERFFDVASFSLMVWLFARMGDRDLAAHQVAAQCLIFVFMPAMAIGDASCVLIGQAFGAGSLDSVPRVQRAALALSFGYVAACSGVLAGFGVHVAGLFVDDAAVTARACELLRIAAVFIWCIPFYHVGQSSLRGLGDVQWAAWITVLAAWGCTPLLAAGLGIGLGMGAPGGWIGLGLEIALASALFFWRLRQRQQARPVRTSSCELRPV
jgi:MATE family multidrug resistance protein